MRKTTAAHEAIGPWPAGGGGGIEALCPLPLFPFPPTRPTPWPGIGTRIARDR